MDDCNCAPPFASRGTNPHRSPHSLANIKRKNRFVSLYLIATPWSHMGSWLSALIMVLLLQITLHVKLSVLAGLLFTKIFSTGAIHYTARILLLILSTPKRPLRNATNAANNGASKRPRRRLQKAVSGTSVIAPTTRSDGKAKKRAGQPFGTKGRYT